MFGNRYHKWSVFFSPDGGGSAGDSGDDDKTPDPEPKIMTQSEVDAIVKDRVARAKESGRTEVLTAIGAKDIDEAKTVVTNAKTLADEKLTADQKRDKDLADANDRAEKAEAERERLIAENLRVRIDAEVVQVATELGFKKESLADIALVLDRSQVTEKDGKLEGVKLAVEDVAKTRPHWLAEKKDDKEIKPTVGTPKPNGNRPAGAPADDASKNPPEKPRVRL